jgi:hypothetical protein
MAHVIPGLAAHSLFSVVTMCNAGCSITFTKIGCTIIYCGRTIVCGHKCTQTGLWMITLTGTPTTTPTAKPAMCPPPIAMAANVEATSSAAEYAGYIHKLLCSPPAATLLHALNRSKELMTIPGLTLALIHAHLLQSTTTNKGHMQCHRANMASTHNTHANIMAACVDVNSMSPSQEVCSLQEMFCFATLAKANTSTMYTDLTGAFHIRSFKNMQYIFVAYIYGLNAIVRPIPSHANATMTAAFTEVFAILWAQDYQPALNVMDNECSKTVEKHIRANRMSIQLVPPHNHQVNAAEWVIATFKEHFAAALATVDMLCPLQLWDKFLPQVELTLNLLRFC